MTPSKFCVKGKRIVEVFVTCRHRVKSLPKQFSIPLAALECFLQELEQEKVFITVK